MYNEIIVKEDKRYDVRVETCICLREHSDYLPKHEDILWEEYESEYDEKIIKNFAKSKNKIWEEETVNTWIDYSGFSFMTEYTLKGVYAYCLEDVKEKIDTWFKGNKKVLGNRFTEIEVYQEKGSWQLMGKWKNF